MGEKDVWGYEGTVVVGCNMEVLNIVEEEKCRGKKSKSKARGK